jgi:hypothetical protein
LYATRNANSCPAGSARIDTEGECQIAASALQLTYEGPYSDRGSPKGCFRYTGATARGIYFNPHATGGGEPDSQPLCKTSTAAPTNLGATYSPSFPPSPYPSMQGALVVLLLVLALLFRMQTPLAPALARSCRMTLRACVCMAVDCMNSTESPHTELCRRRELDRGRHVAVELHGRLRRRDVPARSRCGSFALARARSWPGNTVVRCRPVPMGEQRRMRRAAVLRCGRLPRLRQSGACRQRDAARGDRQLGVPVEDHEPVRPPAGAPRSSLQL